MLDRAKTLLKLNQEIISREDTSHEQEVLWDEILWCQTLIMLVTSDEEERRIQFEQLKALCLNKSIMLEKRLGLYRQLIIYEFRGLIQYKVDLILYKEMLQELQEKIKIKKYSYLEEDSRNRNRVVIITEQFLGRLHAPTKNVLNIVKGIETTRSEVDEIYIINSRGVLPETTAKLYEEICMNKLTYTPQMLNEVLSEYGIERCGVGYEQGDNLLFIDRMAYMVDLIYQLAPIKVIGIGGDNYLTDLVQNFIETYTQGQTVEYPRTTSSYTIHQYLGENIQIEKINSYQQKINIPYSLKYVKDPGKGKAMTREERGIAKDRFLLVVVGNRLAVELKQDFYSMCNAILDRYTFVDVVFIGELTETEVAKYVPKNHIKRYHLWGYRNQMIAELKMCNIFVNPHRQGGGYGRSAAIQAGIPVVSIDYGDVAEFLKDMFKVQNYEEMKAYILKTIEEPLYYQTLKEEIVQVREKHQANAWKMLAESVFQSEGIKYK